MHITSTVVKLYGHSQSLHTATSPYTVSWYTRLHTHLFPRCSSVHLTPGSSCAPIDAVSVLVVGGGMIVAPAHVSDAVPLLQLHVN